MGIFEKLGLAGKADATIDWDITPALAFTIFESWGTKERNVRHKSDRYYYFYIDNWQYKLGHKKEILKNFQQKSLLWETLVQNPSIFPGEIF